MSCASCPSLSPRLDKGLADLVDCTIISYPGTSVPRVWYCSPSWSRQVPVFVSLLPRNVVHQGSNVQYEPSPRHLALTQHTKVSTSRTEPVVTRVADQTATLEGELRFTHSRLLESAEEVALYHGEEFEKNVIERGYFALVKHVNRVLRIRVWHGMAEEGVIKWAWGSFGLVICSLPVFAGSMLGMGPGDLGSRTEGESRPSSGDDVAE